MKADVDGQVGSMDGMNRQLKVGGLKVGSWIRLCSVVSG